MEFKNLKDMLTKFSNEEVCREYLIQKRWNGKPVCPHCGYSEKVYNIENGKRYKCGNKECHKKFSVTVGTVFENSNIPLSTWFAAIYLCTAHKKGISSLQLHRDLGITQKTAWFLLHRIREMLKSKAPHMLKNMVEADETYVGGKVKNKHVSKRKTITNSTSPSIKTAVLGLLERDGKVCAKVVPDVKRTTVLPIIVENIKKGSIIYTDSSHMYTPLKGVYQHESVNHEQNEYVRGACHTNSIEGFWSLLKRGIYGIYHQVSPKHLQRYCDEFEYRYNTRKVLDNERFELSIKNIQGRLKYIDLIKNDDLS